MIGPKIKFKVVYDILDFRQLWTPRRYYYYYYYYYRMGGLTQE